ncbi:MAG: HupE/UreJ family protein [Opitutaceae bacterium]|nr:HupE/UreJ family protein [Opitutaceae bacterium]
MSALAPSRWLAAGVATLAFPGLLLAHNSTTLVYDCAAGLAHPLHGWDHLLALLAVGLWAAQQPGTARGWLPAAFVGGTAVGVVLGAAGGGLPGLEQGLGTSVLVLGALIALAVRPALPLGLGLVTVFALGHGLAHGAEAPASIGLAGYLAGLLLATAALHAAGYAGGRAASRGSALLPRVLGAACAAAGGGLLLA